MKIVDFKSFKESINKLDTMAADKMQMPNTVFTEESSVDKLKKFFDVADGNSIWND